MCPKCDHLMRLSDLQLRAKDKAPKTWMDIYDSKLSSIESKEERFEEMKKSIQEKAALRGRAKVPLLIKKSMDDRFSKLEYDPYDIKALLHPIDFVVFDGMNKDKMKDVVLLSRETKNENLLQLHKGIARAVVDEDYDWKVVRVSEDGAVEYE